MDTASASEGNPFDVPPRAGGPTIGSVPIVAALLVLAFAAPLMAQSKPFVFTPARRLSGSLPSSPPPTVVGWIEEAVEVEVDARGFVDRATLLRATSRGPSFVVPAVADWRFQPATDETGRVPARVLVAAMFRPPALYDNPAPGALLIDLAPPSNEVPFPVQTTRPAYPPQAIADAVVLVEVAVDRDGHVADARIVTGAPGFDEAALTAARGWTFRPARWRGQPVIAFAYLIFGFRQPAASAGCP
jgi:TonB family protein